MASLTKAINKDFIDQILPTYGNPRTNLPIWDQGQKMFLCEEYESESGHRYYTGIRFCDRVVIVERVGIYHNWTYIDGIELYAFNGNNMQLIQKCEYDKEFRNEEFIRKESEEMIRNYIGGMLKGGKTSMPKEQIDEYAKQLVEKCYKSFLDQDFSTRLTVIIPQIEQH